MLKKGKMAGFTLVELTISIAFVSILALTIALITTSVIATYRRGLTLKQINTTGMDLIDDLRSVISNSSARSAINLCSLIYADSAHANSRQNCINDEARNFISISRPAEVIIGKDSLDRKNITDVPIFGAFCSGSYSYIWNSGYFFGDKKLYEVQNVEPISVTYLDRTGEHTASNFRLLKIADPNRAACINPLTSTSPSNYDSLSGLTNHFNLDSGGSYVISEPPIELLSDQGDSGLALYDLSISRPSYGPFTRNALYSGSFILATIQGGINLRAMGNYCATPSEYAIENFDYCAINKFNFAVLANGE